MSISSETLETMRARHGGFVEAGGDPFVAADYLELIDELARLNTKADARQAAADMQLTPEHEAMVQRFVDAARRLEPRDAYRPAPTDADLDLIEDLLRQRDASGVFLLDDRHIELIEHRFAWALLAEVRERLGMDKAAALDARRLRERADHNEQEIDRVYGIADKTLDILLAITARPHMRPPREALDDLRVFNRPRPKKGDDQL
jgi:hypothetical protein